jgi:hypothetical protein
MFANQQFVDDKAEVQECAFILDGELEGAGWLGPDGQKPFDKKAGRLTNVGYDPPNRSGSIGVFIETRSKAASRTKEAASILGQTLRARGVLAILYTDSKLEGISIPNDDVIVITVGRRVP